MDEREELLAQLRQLRRLVLAITERFPVPFSEKHSLLLDWVNDLIERMERRG